MISPDLRGDLTASESTGSTGSSGSRPTRACSASSSRVSDGLIEVRRARTAVHGGTAPRPPRHRVPSARRRGSADNAGARAMRLTPRRPRSPAAAARRSRRPRPASCASCHAPAKETAAVLDRAGDALDVTVTAGLVVERAGAVRASRPPSAACSRCSRTRPPAPPHPARSEDRRGHALGAPRSRRGVEAHRQHRRRRREVPAAASATPAARRWSSPPTAPPRWTRASRRSRPTASCTWFRGRAW